LSVARVFVVPLIVTVLVLFVKTAVALLLSQLPGTVNATEPLIVNVPPALILTSPFVPVEVVVPTERSVLVIVSVPESVNVALTLIALLCVMVPEIVRLLKPAVPFSLTVFPDPESVTVLVPFVNVPAEESQLPEQVHEPVVNEKVVPDPTVTSRKVTVEVLAVRPPVPTSERDAPPVTLLPEVVSVPDPDVASVLLTSIAVVCETVPETVRL
jgi:hypothetical protein